MKKRSCTLVVALVALVVAQLSCGTPSSSQFHSTPTVAPTQTPIVQKVIQTAVVVWTTTPKPTRPSPTATSATRYCISATEAVYLRPSPSISNYPIVELKNGTTVLDLGGRNGNWMFVEIGTKRGWVNRKYIKECE